MDICVINSRTLKCAFLIETTETEKKIDLYANHGLRGASRLTDNEGNSCIASKIELGGKEMLYNIYTTLPPDVPMRCQLTFNNVSNRATSAAILEISGTLDGEGVSTFAIRDISPAPTASPCFAGYVIGLKR